MLELLLLVALLILIAIVYKPLTRIVFGALDGHAAKVRAELDAAKRLREEAQSLLAEHQRRLAAGEDQAHKIVGQAQAEVQRQTERHRSGSLEAALQRRTAQAMERIEREEARALQEVRTQAATSRSGPPSGCSRISSTGAARGRCWMTRLRRSAASCPDTRRRSGR